MPDAKIRYGGTELVLQKSTDLIGLRPAGREEAVGAIVRVGGRLARYGLRRRGRRRAQRQRHPRRCTPGTADAGAVGYKPRRRRGGSLVRLRAGAGGMGGELQLERGGPQLPAEHARRRRRLPAVPARDVMAAAR